MVLKFNCSPSDLNFGGKRPDAGASITPGHGCSVRCWSAGDRDILSPVRGVTDIHRPRVTFSPALESELTALLGIEQAIVASARSSKADPERPGGAGGCRRTILMAVEDRVSRCASTVGVDSELAAITEPKATWRGRHRNSMRAGCSIICMFIRMCRALVAVLDVPLIGPASTTLARSWAPASLARSPREFQNVGLTHASLRLRRASFSSGWTGASPRLPAWKKSFVAESSTPGRRHPLAFAHQAVTQVWREVTCYPAAREQKSW